MEHPGGPAGAKGGDRVKATHEEIDRYMIQKGFEVQIYPNRDGTVTYEQNIFAPDYVPTGKAGAPKGLRRPDRTYKRGDEYVLIQTVTTDGLRQPRGLKPNSIERENAEAIHQRRPKDTLFLIPKLAN